MTNFGFKARNQADRDALNLVAIEKYGNEYPCDMYGRFPWDTELRGDQYRNRRGVSLSRACLGDLCYEVLSRFGNITSFYAMFGNSPRSFVGTRVWLTLEGRDDMIHNTKFALNPPPVAHLN